MSSLKYLWSLMLIVLFAVPAEAVTPAPQPAVGKAVSVGVFSVVPLLDGAHSFSLKLFKGADEAAMLKTAGAQPVAGSFNVFLIKRDKERFLVDTGNGTLRPERSGQLLPCLTAAGTAPEDISKIFITHLHGDHIGGLVKDGATVFPRAKVYVAKPEYAYWTNEEALRQAPEGRRGLFTLVRDVLGVLEQNKQLVFFTPGELVAPDIASVALFGHTPGHSGFMLASEGKKLFFIGDLLHAGALQLPRPDITVDFDVDQPTAKETRLRAFKQITEDKIPIAAAHLPFPGIGLILPEGDGYKLEELK